MKRIDEIDIMRGMAMLMVVIGHTQCPKLMHDMFYYVHIPLFFMLSGCMKKKDEFYYDLDNVKQLIVKRIKRLYLPYLMFASVITLLHNVFYQIGFYKDYYSGTDFIKQMVRVVAFSPGNMQSLLQPLWFLKVLFICGILYALFVYASYRIKKNKWVLIGPLTVMALLIKGDATPLIHGVNMLNANMLWPLAAVLYYAVGGEYFRVLKTA